MDIEQRDHEKTVAVLRELAGLRTRVPSHGAGDPSRPPFNAADLNLLRARVRELAQAIVDGGDDGAQRRIDRRVRAARVLTEITGPRVAFTARAVVG